MIAIGIVDSVRSIAHTGDTEGTTDTVHRPACGAGVVVACLDAQLRAFYLLPAHTNDVTRLGDVRSSADGSNRQRPCRQDHGFSNPCLKCEQNLTITGADRNDLQVFFTGNLFAEPKHRAEVT